MTKNEKMLLAGGLAVIILAGPEIMKRLTRPIGSTAKGIASGVGSAAGSIVTGLTNFFKSASASSDGKVAVEDAAKPAPQSWE